MKYINKLDFEGYLEDATRHDAGAVYLDGPRTKFILRLLHEQLHSHQEKLNEVIDELNYQRKKRMDLEDVLKRLHPELILGEPNE